ncbi:hypothetical protein PENSPDRAFT_661856 [Peniophora sp. CONT]|nr:hypothetical protein PENSPDRAFT_661856 [Peniophora sp. CONT]
MQRLNLSVTAPSSSTTTPGVQYDPREVRFPTPPYGGTTRVHDDSHLNEQFQSFARLAARKGGLRCTAPSPNLALRPTPAFKEKRRQNPQKCDHLHKRPEADHKLALALALRDFEQQTSHIINVQRSNPQCNSRARYLQPPHVSWEWIAHGDDADIIGPVSSSAPSLPATSGGVVYTAHSSIPGISHLDDAHRRSRHTQSRGSANDPESTSNFHVIRLG